MSEPHGEFKMHVVWQWMLCLCYRSDDSLRRTVTEKGDGLECKQFIIGARTVKTNIVTGSLVRR
jgi:hypothetical protein